MSAINLPVGARIVQRGGKPVVVIQTDPVDGVARICEIVGVPDPPRLFSCPCCGRSFVFSQHADGSVTLAPSDYDDGDIPF